MTPDSIRVLVVDDHEVVRRGIQALLGQIEGIEVVGEAGNGLEAIEQADRLRPNVILMDLLMPEMDGIQAMRHISSQGPEARFLVMTSYSGDDLVFPAIKAGALGFLLKDTKSEELVAAIREVHRGEPSLHPSIARKLLREVSGSKPEKPAPEPDRPATGDCRGHRAFARQPHPGQTAPGQPGSSHAVRASRGAGAPGG
jgi:NarL family two-component system response regulator LiaR